MVPFVFVSLYFTHGRGQSVVDPNRASHQKDPDNQQSDEQFRIKHQQPRVKIDLCAHEYDGSYHEHVKKPLFPPSEGKLWSFGLRIKNTDRFIDILSLEVRYYLVNIPVLLNHDHVVHGSPFEELEPHHNVQAGLNREDSNQLQNKVRLQEQIERIAPGLFVTTEDLGAGIPQVEDIFQFFWFQQKKPRLVEHGHHMENEGDSSSP